MLEEEWPEADGGDLVQVACPRSQGRDAQTHVIKACRHINHARHLAFTTSFSSPTTTSLYSIA